MQFSRAREELAESMSVALKDNIAKPFKGESHDDDATCLFWFAGATGPDRDRRRAAYGTPGFDRTRPLKRD